MTKRIDDGWEKANCYLDQIDNSNMDFLKNPYFKKFFMSPISKHTEVCKEDIKDMMDFLGPLENINILEVGAGFGNFCLNINEKINISEYTILDTKSMTRFSSKFLEHHGIKCNFIHPENLEDLFCKKFNLFISIGCLSETPKQYMEDIIENILPNCNMAYIKDGNSSDDNKYNNYLKSSFEKNFENTTKFPASCKLWNQKEIFIYMGRINNKKEGIEK